MHTQYTAQAPEREGNTKNYKTTSLPACQSQKQRQKKWRFEDTGTGTLTSAGDWMAGRQQDCRELRLDGQTASLSLSSKEKKQRKYRQKIVVHPSRVEKVKLSKRQCILMNIFLNSWKIRFSTSLNPTNILYCSKKEFIRHTKYGNTLLCPVRVSQVQI